MCSKIGKLSAGQSAGIGFGIDAGVCLLNFFTGQKETNRENEAIKRRNQLAINVYETKNRNAELAWRNDKTDSDIEVDNKWRETIDAIAESQLKARQTAGEQAVGQVPRRPRPARPTLANRTQANTQAEQPKPETQPHRQPWQQLERHLHLA